MPSGGGSAGLANGASPIESGVAGVTRGLFKAFDGSSVAGVLALYDSAGVPYYLNAGSAGTPRFGPNDPSSDEDVNDPLSVAAGGLAVDGANWMTGRFMTSDLRLTSRNGVLTSIDDDFDNATIDAALWTSRGTPTESTYLECNATNEGVVSTYKLSGDFDVRAIFTTASASFDATTGAYRMSLWLSFDPAKDANAIGAPGVDLVYISWIQDNQLAGYNARYWHSINNSGGNKTPASAGTVANIYGAVRVVRTGNSFALYYRDNQATLPDITTDDDWILAQSGTFTPTRDEALLAIGQANSPGSLTSRCFGFYAKTGSAVPAAATGPAWKMGGLSVLASTEDFLKVFNGPEAVAANEIAKITATGAIWSGLDNSLPGYLISADGGADQPGRLVLYDDANDPYYVWADAGELRIHSADVSTAATDGLFLGPLAYAGIYLQGGSTLQSLNATPGTFDKVTGFAADMTPSSGITPAHATDDLTVTKAGVYLVSYSIGFDGEAATYLLRIGIDGVAQAAGETDQIVPVALGEGHLSAQVLFTLTAGQVLSLMAASSDVVSADFTPRHAQLLAVRIG